MVVELSTILDALKTLGVPVAYLAFTMWLLLREQGRTREAEARNLEMQNRLFDLSRASVEAALRNEAAVSALVRREAPVTGQWAVPDVFKKQSP